MEEKGGIEIMGDQVWNELKESQWSVVHQDGVSEVEEEEDM